MRVDGSALVAWYVFELVNYNSSGFEDVTTFFGIVMGSNAGWAMPRVKLRVWMHQPKLVGLSTIVQPLKPTTRKSTVPHADSASCPVMVATAYTSGEA